MASSQQDFSTAGEMPWLEELPQLPFGHAEAFAANVQWLPVLPAHLQATAAQATMDDWMESAMANILSGDADLLASQDFCSNNAAQHSGGGGDASIMSSQQMMSSMNSMDLMLTSHQQFLLPDEQQPPQQQRAGALQAAAGGGLQQQQVEELCSALPRAADIPVRSQGNLASSGPVFMPDPSDNLALRSNPNAISAPVETGGQTEQAGGHGSWTSAQKAVVGHKEDAEERTVPLPPHKSQCMAPHTADPVLPRPSPVGNLQGAAKTTVTPKTIRKPKQEVPEQSGSDCEDQSSSADPEEDHEDDEDDEFNVKGCKNMYGHRASSGAAGSVRCSIEQLREVFHLPGKKAADVLGISNNLLKRHCRVLGIKRWPYRKVTSLINLKQAIEEDETISADDKVEVLQRIEVDLAAVMADPNHCLEQELQDLRQVHYKQRYVSRTKGPVAAGSTKAASSAVHSPRTSHMATSLARKQRLGSTKDTCAPLPSPRSTRSAGKTLPVAPFDKAETTADTQHLPSPASLPKQSDAVHSAPLPVPPGPASPELLGFLNASTPGTVFDAEGSALLTLGADDSGSDTPIYDLLFDSRLPALKPRSWDDVPGDLQFEMEQIHASVSTPAQAQPCGSNMGSAPQAGGPGLLPGVPAASSGSNRVSTTTLADSSTSGAGAVCGGDGAQYLGGVLNQHQAVPRSAASSMSNLPAQPDLASLLQQWQAQAVEGAGGYFLPRTNSNDGLAAVPSPNAGLRACPSTASTMASSNGSIMCSTSLSPVTSPSSMLSAVPTAAVYVHKRRAESCSGLHGGAVHKAAALAHTAFGGSAVPPQLRSATASHLGTLGSHRPAGSQPDTWFLPGPPRQAHEMVDLAESFLL